ncbi:tRNA-splicing endonuclease subunit Sen2-1 isoform X2 [Drosophila subpulchrella]|uniref:tRNA-splicing endonuclease subunit Sen2-1 isoform X2 n=1 Tax=Drosophila subpulchrella TaxID=1486046 RepID=UPI0018A16CC4|nr:tRNA-splicing endonuclease subunit Sen2-1 isoform X2 [Drosophila subpulchrella]
MQFSFPCKRKRCFNKNLNFTPFPSCEIGERYQGRFTGLSVEGSKSRGGPASGDEDETLLLGLEESCFLAYYLNTLEITNLTGSSMDYQAFLESANKLNERFVENLACYLYLKSKNWVIKSGIKFGGDFLIYKQSPRLYHASFLVIVQTPCDTDYYQSKNLKGVQRVAETSDKDVLLLTVHRPKDVLNPKDLQETTVTETIVRRFNYLTFVQSKQQ